MSAKIENLKSRVDLLYEKSRWTELISVLEKIIPLEEKSDEIMYLYKLLGVACLMMNEHDKGIANLEKAKDIDNEHPLVYGLLGVLYDGIDDHKNSVKNFLEAGKLDDDLKTESHEAYIASQISAIHAANKNDRDGGLMEPLKDRDGGVMGLLSGVQATDEKDEDGEFFKLLLELSKVIIKIQTSIFLKKRTDVVHYTSLHALKNLSSNGRFRLYNANYMDDPEEGRVFFKIMKEYGMSGVEKLFYGKGTNVSYNSPVYIGSFVQIDHNKQKDTLPLWRTYGKHDDKEAAGACLRFERKRFATQYETKIGAMEQIKAGKKGAIPYLYEITYISPNDWKLRQQQKRDKNFVALTKILDDMKKYMRNAKNKKKKKAIVCELIDSIRFLFKTTHYSEEKEVRVLAIHYVSSKSHKQDVIKEDKENITPRLYVEIPKEFLFSEVILGPRVKHLQDWKMWINWHDENVKVRKSKIKYGR